MHVCALCDPGSLVRTVGGGPGAPALRFPEVLQGPKGDQAQTIQPVEEVTSGAGASAATNG